MARDPFDAHLCARGPAAAESWRRGFESAAWWVQELLTPAAARLAYELVRDSSGGLDWSRAPVLHEPWGEGWMLGVYGVVALQLAEAS